MFNIKNKKMKKELSAETKGEQRTDADNSTSASVEASPMLSAALSWWQSLSVNERQNLRWLHGNAFDGYMSEEKIINVYRKK